MLAVACVDDAELARPPCIEMHRVNSTSIQRSSRIFVIMAGVAAQVRDKQGAGGWSAVDGHRDPDRDRHAGKREGGCRRVRAEPGGGSLRPQAGLSPSCTSPRAHKTTAQFTSIAYARRRLSMEGGC